MPKQNVGEAKVLEQNEKLVGLCEQQQKEITALTAARDAIEKKWNEGCRQYELKGDEVAELTSELDAARQALMELALLVPAVNWSSATSETRRAYDAAGQAQIGREARKER